jgi:small GTP-binding protein
MNPQRTFHGILLLAFLAFVGFLLVYIPPQLVAQYRTVAELGRVWVYLYFGVVGLGAAILLSTTLWILWQLYRRSRRKRQHRQRTALNPSQLSNAQRQQEIDANLAAIRDLQTDAAVEDDVRRELDPLVGRFLEKRQSHQLEIVAFGTISSGKSSLLNALAGRDVFPTDPRGGTTLRRHETPWQEMDQVTLVDTPGLSEVSGAERAATAADAAQDADLILLAVDGPVRAAEYDLLERLGQMEKPIIICLNKEDWYEQRDRQQLLQQIREQVARYVSPADVVAVRARPTQRLRVRVLPDGSQVEERVEVPPDIGPLAERMTKTLRGRAESLLLANLLLQSRGLVDEAKQRVRESLDRRAWQVVDRYTWGAGGAAALSPFPFVDLAAGCAISSKMVVDLARVYRQDLDLESAVKLLGELGKNLIAILGVSAATPAVAAAVASLLKTVPGAGTIAGGLLQGLVQALVTRWIGAVFVAYFRDEMRTPMGGLTGLARREWERVTSISELRKLIQTARQTIDHPEQDEQT